MEEHPTRICAHHSGNQTTPSKILESTRVPIPKGDQGDSHPITILNDLYCFILGLQAKRVSSACEKLGIIPNDVQTYRTGMSTNHISIPSLCMTEDALESSNISAKVNEDEQKFFDRISLDIHLAAMITQGFPAKGYIECKVEDMLNRTVTVVTRLGNASCTYRCGLMQGHPLSCIISNLVSIFKHRALRSTIHPNLTCSPEHESPPISSGYKFHIYDPNDSQLYIMASSYGDDMEEYLGMDNNKDNSIHNFLREIQAQLNRSGDINLITKIGRSGAKSAITLYNIPLHMSKYVPQLSSIAWDYETDSIIKETIPTYCHFLNKDIDTMEQSPATKDK